MINGPVIETLKGGLGQRVITADNIKGFITNGVVNAVYTTLGVVKKITSIKGAEDLGFNAAYDKNNEVLVYHEMAEFFRLCPDGTIYLKVVGLDQTVTLLGTTHLEALLKDEEVKDRISSIMIQRNVDDEYTPVVTEGVNAEYLTAVPAIQAKLDALEGDGIFVGTVLLAVRELDNSYSDNHNWFTDDSPGVAIWAGQEHEIANIDLSFDTMSNVGTALGAMAHRRISESIAAPKVLNPVKKFRNQDTVSMTEPDGTRWAKAQVGDEVNVLSLTDANHNDLVSKGYLFVSRIKGTLKGMYITDSRTACDSTNDQAYIERREVLQKAKHLAYQTVWPYKNYSVELQEGMLNEGFRTWFESEVTDRVLGQLRFEGNISDWRQVEGAGVFIDPDYNFVTGEHATDPSQNVSPETLVLKILVPIKGILRNITVKVGLKA